MAENLEQGHHEEGKSTQRLLVEILNALIDTERRNETRHNEVMAALREKVDVLGRLNALRSRLDKIAKALKTLDAAT